MYCRRCGKKIDYDSEYCYECLNEEMIFGSDYFNKGDGAKPVRRTTGLTKGIIALGLCEVAAQLANMALILQVSKWQNTLPWVIALLDLAFGALVVPIIFIKQNFDLYKQVRKDSDVKLLPIYIINFVSIATMSLMLFVSALTVILAITI